jgi:hypothetical protein
MMRPAIGCGAFGLAALLLPVDVSAHGFLAKGFPAAHFGLHRGHDHHMRMPYGYGYVGPVATYTPGMYAQPVIVVPTSLAPSAPVVVPRCRHSREIVIVPSESGGERRVTITRC